jgi:hypothetical protein
LLERFGLVFWLSPAALPLWVLFPLFWQPSWLFSCSSSENSHVELKGFLIAKSADASGSSLKLVFEERYVLYVLCF